MKFLFSKYIFPEKFCEIDKSFILGDCNNNNNADDQPDLNKDGQPDLNKEGFDNNNADAEFN